MPLILDPEQIEKLTRRQTAKKTNPVRNPVVAERQMARQMAVMWEKSVFPSLQRIKEAIASVMDEDDLALLIERELRLSEMQWGPAGERILDMWRTALDKHNKAQMERSLGKALQIDISAVLDSDEVRSSMQWGISEAYRQIKSIPQESIGQVMQAVTDNMRGIPLPENRSLMEQINHISGKQNFRKRAKLIARDQTSKLNSLMVQTRQQSIGVETYIWRTSKDQRVVGRPGGLYPKGNKAHGNHWIMEGKLCRWDDATVYSKDGGKTWIKRTGEMPKTHPGIDIQCRCHAEPVLDIQKIIEYAMAA